MGQSRRGPLAGRRFVWLLAPPWHGVWTRQNHFAIRLARLGAEVLYVENPSAWTSLLKQRRWSELPAVNAPRMQQIEPGLHLMQPAFSLPGGKTSDRVATWNGRRIAAQVRGWMRSQGWENYACWCRIPGSLFALRELAPEQTIYDVTDDYELYEEHPQARLKVAERERQMVARADLVFITSEELRQKSALADAQLLPNGVDFELFSQANEPGEIHPLVAAAQQPVIGYLGLTSRWMDFDLLTKLGTRWPGQVVMVGPISAHVEAQARAIPGLVWTGFVPQAELAPYLRGFDVCIMPHLVNELRRRSNPLKLCEYLATGKPFVSVDLPALEPFRQLVDVARDADEFMRLVELRLGQPPNQPLAAQRQSAARAFSWDAIFAQLLDHLQPALQAAA